jgi:hypothetical protein
MKANAQVTAPGAATNMIEAVSTRPNRQNRSACSRMSVASVHQPYQSAELYRANRERCVSFCTLRIIIILMETIKDLYKTPAEKTTARHSVPTACSPHSKNDAFNV